MVSQDAPKVSREACETVAKGAATGGNGRVGISFLVALLQVVYVI